MKTMGSLACSKAEYIAYLRTQTVDGLPLLFTLGLKEKLGDTLQQFISVLAQCAVDAIDKVRLKTERDLLAEISNLANQSTSRNDFLHSVVYTIRDAFQAGGCSILRYDKFKDKLILGGTTGIVDSDTGLSLDSVEYERGDGSLTEWIWQNRRTIRLWDEDERKKIDPTGSLNVGTKSAETHHGDWTESRSFIAAPILLGPEKREERQLIGVIRLLKKRDPVGFLPYDEQLLEFTRSVLAPIIERWNATTEKDDEFKLQQSLFGIIEAMHIHDEPDPKFILNTIAAEARQLFGGYMCSVLLKEPNEDKLRFVADDGDHEPIKQIVIKLSDGLSGHAVRHRETVAVPDVKEDDRYYESLPEIESEICAPILFDDDCLGVLVVSSNQKGTFREEDERTKWTIETFAKQAAIALHRAQVLREREQWRSNLARTTQMLTASNVASGLAHELKNGLAAISATAQGLEPDPAIRMKKLNRDRLDRIRQVSHDLYSLAERLMDLSKVGKPYKQKVHLNDVIEESMELIEELIRDKKMKPVVKLDVGLSTGHQLELDTKQIQQILTNLVLNAIDASHRGQRIVVSTRNISPEWAAFSVQDFGEGIKPEDKKHIFDMFFTTKPNGFGVGLSVVKTLVEENHGGEINIDTKFGKGTTVTVRLPK